MARRLDAAWPPPPEKWVVCAYPGCEEKIRDHMWGHIKATGWFFERNGPAWCPDHTPKWVAEWREKQKKKREQGA